MPKFSKLILLSSAIIVIANVCGKPAQAFMTFCWFGGAIHRDILKQALTPLGLASSRLKSIGKGTDSQDIPGSTKYATCPQNHCDDNQIAAGRDYWRGRVKQAVEDAGGADTDSKRRDKALFEFGEAMHTVQDFYSHSNYLEWLLQNHKTLEPVDWDTLPAAVSTGYYYYQRPLDEEGFVSRARSVRGLAKKHQHLLLHSASQYDSRKESASYGEALNYALAPGQFLHKELNKDSAKTMEGRIVAPQFKKTFHQLARDLAVADTARQWANFEQLIKNSYGIRAPEIMAALKAR